MVAQHGGTTLCAVISPYRAIRDEARRIQGELRRGLLQHAHRHLRTARRQGNVCQGRAAVADGKPMGFTGVDDPYEPPANPEVTLDTTSLSVQACVDQIIDKMLEMGYILPHGHIVE